MYNVQCAICTICTHSFGTVYHGLRLKIDNLFGYCSEKYKYPVWITLLQFGCAAAEKERGNVFLFKG